MNEKVHNESQEQHIFCLEWAAWHRSRRLFAPPIPLSILARLRPQVSNEVPDAPLSADLSYFNLAVLGYKECTGKDALYYYYIHHLRPIKTVAEAMEISTSGFYKAMREVRNEIYVAHKRMMDGNIEVPEWAESVD